MYANCKAIWTTESPSDTGKLLWVEGLYVMKNFLC